MGGRSLSMVPIPRRLLARRRGGSSGSSCFSPFFCILKHFICLGHLIWQRVSQLVLQAKLLNSMSPIKKCAIVQFQLLSQLQSGSALHKAPHYKHNRPAVVVCPCPDRVGKYVVHVPAFSTAIVNHRSTPAIMRRLTMRQRMSVLAM